MPRAGFSCRLFSCLPRQQSALRLARRLCAQASAALHVLERGADLTVGDVLDEAVQVQVHSASCKRAGEVCSAFAEFVGQIPSGFDGDLLTMSLGDLTHHPEGCLLLLRRAYPHLVRQLVVEGWTPAMVRALYNGKKCDTKAGPTGADGLPIKKLGPRSKEYEDAKSAPGPRTAPTNRCVGSGANTPRRCHQALSPDAQATGRRA